MTQGCNGSIAAPSVENYLFFALSTADPKENQSCLTARSRPSCPSDSDTGSARHPGYFSPAEFQAL